MSVYRDYIKRFLDCAVAFVGLIVLSPLLILVIVLLSVANKGAGVFFVQQRPGKHGKIFNIYKFKTMNDLRDASGELLSDEERMTPVGNILRKLSIDELPQLWNVLNGDMSIVGPRPLRVEYLPLYSDCQARRHEVMPGITGWAQCHGRNILSWEDRFELDVWYVDHLSFRVDAKIIWLTIIKVIVCDGISSEGYATMAPFHGNQKSPLIDQ